MTESRYLTKSKFRLAMECPSKLYYAGKNEYANLKLQDEFLQNLANGGFQVGALAKSYFPEGTEVTAQDPEEALAQTEELLKAENITVFEPAFLYKQFYVRPDIVVKQGNKLELIEVKAKSCDFADEGGFLNKDLTVKADWLDKIEDIAFQRYVVAGACGEFEVTAFLMLADKTAICPSDGLNQKFKLVTADGQKKIEVSADLNEIDLSVRLLRPINVDATCTKVYDGSAADYKDGYTFEQRVNLFADSYLYDRRLDGRISSKCKTCEFQALSFDPDAELKSGFHECWGKGLGWKESDFAEPTVLDIWNFQGKEKLIKEGRIKISSVTIDDIKPKPDEKAGLSNKERQWLQIEKYQNSNADIYLDSEGLRAEMTNWTYPLNLIDFETSMPVIPFKKGRRPYEGIAFQFSHHLLHDDGKVEHANQFLGALPGEFPNYEFVRALKVSLETNTGSVFRYHNHENTYLNFIYRQLLADPDDIEDREQLCQFIKTITTSTQGSDEEWQGERNMIDLHEMVRRYYYDPATKGSISIKDVLPAVLSSSAFLQEKYSEPIYGTEDGIPSLNFTEQRWVEFENEKVLNPYKLLPKLFVDETDHDNQILLSEVEAINNGGAAMTAYAKLQFQEMSLSERQEIEAALLKYCELDTLAMVMICEAWRALL